MSVILIHVVADIIMILVFVRRSHKLDILCPIHLYIVCNKICFSQSRVIFPIQFLEKCNFSTPHFVISEKCDYTSPELIQQTNN